MILKENVRKHEKLIERVIRLFCSIRFVMSNVGKPIIYHDTRISSPKNKGYPLKHDAVFHICTLEFMA